MATVKRICVSLTFFKVALLENHGSMNSLSINYVEFAWDVWMAHVRMM